MTTIYLANETDWAGFRIAARQHLLSDSTPTDIQWRVRGAEAGLFDEGESPDDVAPFSSSALPTSTLPTSAPPTPAPPTSALPKSALPNSALPNSALPNSAPPNSAPAIFAPAIFARPASAPPTSHPPAAAPSEVLPGFAPAEMSTVFATSGMSRPPSSLAAPTVSRAFMTLAESVILHVDSVRFDLIYRLLWRMQHEPGLRHDPLDPDVMKAQAMARVVHRDMHKMKAFVRFRPIERADADPLYVAWFEPEHHIVAATAPFFRDRYTAMHWAILTPRQCVSWDGHTLTFTPGASREDAPDADAGEALWLTYYTHIFNPARLKLNMMRKEMPRKYWHNLPEAKLISQLANESNVRMAQMIEAPASVPTRRIVPIRQAARQAASDQRCSSHAARGHAASGHVASSHAASSHAASGHAASGHAASGHAASGHAADGQAANAYAATSAAESRQLVQSCRDCAIGQHATQAVWGEGPEHARLMVVGEQPGDQEDLRGRPFVGPAGKLFDRALDELGWSRSQLYVTNAVKHFKFEPRGKKRIHKTPAQRETAACAQWLDLELAQVRPQAIIALGATAARALLGRAVAVTQFRGQWVDSPSGTPVLVTLHPSALLRMDPAVQADAWQAWLRDLSQANSLVLDA